MKKVNFLFPRLNVRPALGWLNRKFLLPPSYKRYFFPTLFLLFGAANGTAATYYMGRFESGTAAWSACYEAKKITSCSHDGSPTNGGYFYNVFSSNGSLIAKYTWLHSSNCASWPGSFKQFGRCYKRAPKDQGGCSAGRVMAGNPCNVGNGNKYQREVIIRAGNANALGFELTYNSYNYASNDTAADLSALWQGAFGRQWISRYEARVKTQFNGALGAKRPDGREYEFHTPGANGVYLKDADVRDSLQRLFDSQNLTVGWVYKDSETEEVEHYDTNGRLVSILDKNGELTELFYNDGIGSYYPSSATSCDGIPNAPAGKRDTLACVANAFGRQINFGYDANSRINQLRDPEGITYLFSYDEVSSYCPTGGCNNLTGVTYPGGSKRTYFYNELVNASGVVFTSALTGILDENGNRFATYKYDSSFRAISTEHGGGAEKVSIVYTTDSNGNVTSSAVTDALNTTRTYTFTNILGVAKNTGVTQPCISGCGTASATTYDTNGNIASKTDFNGVVTSYTYDLTRNLETSRTEAHGTPQTRTITTTWHATYRLPTLITEPGKTTSFNYDANGNLLSKTITDTALSTSRTWSWTYNALG